jgi:hypothetical protein
MTAAKRDSIVDYFNDCAEECLLYVQGYIPGEVWRAWCRGMAWYLKRHRFRDVWNEEIASASYYGLTHDIILEGAA